MPDDSPSSWLDLALYLGVGVVLLLTAGWGLGLLGQVDPLLGSVLTYGVNVVVFGGAVLLVGVLRGRLSLAAIGFWPARLPAAWLRLAAFLAVIFLPVRAGLALLAQYLLEGNLDSLTESPRLDIFAPSGFSWLSFGATLLLAGILVPIAEELFFRGALYTWLRGRMGAWPAVLVSSALFALGHADTFAVVITSFVLGAINAVLFERSRTLWAPIAVHMVNNSLAVILLYLALLTGTA